MLVMHRGFLLAVALVAIQTLITAMVAPASTPVPASPVASPVAACPVTEPNGATLPGGMVDPNAYGNEWLATSLWDDGEVIFEPGGPGFVLPDGGLGVKWGWVPSIPGELTISGERIDAPAAPLRSEISEGWIGDVRFFPSYLVFSTPGCWKVTGELNGHSLTFVTLVVLKGDGPDWRAESIP